MAKFATECMLKLKQLIIDLARDYGEETMELSLRIGLHSGPVTAGVLRGDRSRFQLFGDTVNTAARMESHGIPGRIHCSQSTADQLLKKGKGAWLTPRDQSINAKGKGILSTYWIEASRSATNRTYESKRSLSLYLSTMSGV